MKKIALFVVAALVAVLPLAAAPASAAEETLVLRVANWVDYIGEGIL